MFIENSSLSGSGAMAIKLVHKPSPPTPLPLRERGEKRRFALGKANNSPFPFGQKGEKALFVLGRGKKSPTGRGVGERAFINDTGKTPC